MRLLADLIDRACGTIHEALPQQPQRWKTHSTSLTMESGLYWIIYIVDDNLQGPFIARISGRRKLLKDQRHLDILGPVDGSETRWQLADWLAAKPSTQWSRITPPIVFARE